MSDHRHHADILKKRNMSDSYFGGKGAAGVAQTIINQIPPHDELIVPFAGHCFVSRTIKPCRRLVLCDLADDVAEWWQGRLPSHAEFHQLDGMGFMRSLVAGSGVTGSGDPRGTSETAAVDRVIYFDPPYHPETRTSGHKYKHDWDEDRHTAFLQEVSTIPASKAFILISGYNCGSYDAVLGDSASRWRRIDFRAMTRGGVRVESLWMNFDRGDLHDYRFLGSDKREREKLAKRDRNLIRRLEQLPKLERNRLLAAVADRFGDFAGTDSRNGG